MARFTFVGGYIRSIGERKPKEFTVECAFSNGKGLNPFSTLTSQDCSVCKGTGWVTLPGKPEDYKRCGMCNGSGREQDALRNLAQTQPCHICKGSGLVRIS
jgi:DnaJ-class molecular chaperone